MKTKQIEIEKLVEDFSLYPRTMVSNVTVNRFAEALAAGTALPPIRVEAQSLRVIDGFHRLAAHRKLGLTSIPAVLEEVKDEADFYLRAVAANSSHGSPFTPFDYARIIIRARELGLEKEQVAISLHITPARLEDIQRDYFAKGGDGLVPLKRTIGHMANKQLTRRQVEANKRLGGMQQTFYVNQLIELIEADLINWDNEVLSAALVNLHELLEEALRARSAA